MHCPICSGLPHERFSVKYTTVEKCSSCGHIYALDPGVDMGVQSWPDPDAMLNVFAERNRRLINFWQKSGFLGTESKLLDFGAGPGHILRSVAAQLPNVSINCIEADATASKYLKSLNFNVFNDLSESTVGGYDAVLLIEVIEHVNDPVDLLRKLKSRLSPSGKIFATTGIGETRSGSRNTHIYDTPEHVHFWTENSFDVCCSKAGLAYTPAPAPAGYMYPRANWAIGLLRETAYTVRDVFMGRHHLVGFLEPT